MATRYVPGASSIEIPLRDTDEVSLQRASFCVCEGGKDTNSIQCALQLSTKPHARIHVHVCIHVCAFWYCVCSVVCGVVKCVHGHMASLFPVCR